MDKLRFASVSENPRNLLGSMPNNFMVQKPMTPIINRFRLMLKNREDEIRDLAQNDLLDIPPPTTDEIVAFYESILSELTLNSKPMITDLTIIADDQREHGDGIADAICARIIEVSVEHKLPSLYLLDSIVKNIGNEYVRYFSERLPEVFCEAYRQVIPSVRTSMRHLFRTWSGVFPPSILYRIEDELQFSPAPSRRSSGLTPSGTSGSPRPMHGIHVNPEYLETRRQLGHSTDHTNIHHPGEASSSKLHGNHTVGYDNYAFESAGIIPKPGMKRLISTDHANRQRCDIPDAYGYSSGDKIEGPRALIDAYGKDQGKHNCKPPRDGYMITSGISNKVAVRPWQNIEEEEFDWEDMSPPLLNGRLHTDSFSSSKVTSENLTRRPGYETQTSVSLENDMRRGSLSGWAQLPSVRGSSSHDDALPSATSGHGLVNNISGIRNMESHFPVSHNPPEVWHSPHDLSQSSKNDFHAKVNGRNFQVPFLASIIEHMSPLINGFPNNDAPGSLVSASRLISTGYEPLNPDIPSASLPAASTGVMPSGNMQNAHLLPGLAALPLQKRVNHFSLMSASATNVDQGLDMSFSGQQKFNNSEHKTVTNRLPQFPHQTGIIRMNHPNQAQRAVFQHPVLMRQDVRQNFILPTTMSAQPHLRPPHLNHGYVPRGPFVSNILLNPIPDMRPGPLLLNNPNLVMHLQRGAAPPLPLGPRSTPSQMIPPSQNVNFVSTNPPAGVAFSGLVNSLMAQGVISLTNQPPMQDHVGLEFNSDLLKVRYESAITSLYADLPRQCTTCGIRFKCQEEHSSHMDWHVTKNRTSRNQKQKPSRKWFVSVEMWLSGAEALGADIVPGFLPGENVPEKKDDEELAVPADEDQNICALCGEPFDDFYSDETEEWMYRGATYMNAGAGLTSDMDRSQLGPIVHAKCRSETYVASSEIFGKNETGYTGEDIQRKRMRT